MKRHWAFSWGYWGWGNHTSEFVDAVDVIERGRGKRPPIFADIRFSRAVRAPGFRGNAFEEVVGKNRYHWLRKLGNERIGSRREASRLPMRPESMICCNSLQMQTSNTGESSAPANGRATAIVWWSRLLVNSASREGIPLLVTEWPGEQ
jgi:hypothetical protein